MCYQIGCEELGYDDGKNVHRKLIDNASRAKNELTRFASLSSIY